MSSRECTSDGILDLKKGGHGAWPLPHFSSSSCMSLSRLATPSWRAQYRKLAAGLITPRGRLAKTGDFLPAWHKILNSSLRHPPLHLQSEHISIYFSRRYQYSLSPFLAT